METSTFKQLLDLWPQGATAIGLAAIAILLFKFVVTPWADRQDARKKATREAAKEAAERELQAEQAQLDARVRIAECQKEMAVLMSDTTKLAMASHERCHARLEQLKRN